MATLEELIEGASSSSSDPFPLSMVGLSGSVVKLPRCFKGSVNINRRSISNYDGKIMEEVVEELTASTLDDVEVTIEIQAASQTTLGILLRITAVCSSLRAST